MTTADPPVPTTLVEVWTTERGRLQTAVAAAAAQAGTSTTALAVAQTALTAASSALAAWEQEASQLRQALAAATTRPERHRIELALDVNGRDRLRALRRQVAAAARVASTQARIVRQTAEAGALAGKLTQAEAALAQAQADAATVATSRANLAGALKKARQDADALPFGAADTRLDTLLGLPEMRTGLVTRLDGVVTAQDALRTAAATADAAVHAAAAERSAVDGAVDRTAAAHGKALADITHALAAPDRVARAAAAVAAVLALLERLPPAEEEIIKKAAEAAKAAATGPGGGAAGPPAADAGPTPLETWALCVPAAVRDPAVELILATRGLGDLRTVEPDERVTALDKALTTAEKAYAAAVHTQLTTRHSQEDATSKAATAHDDVTVHEATVADRLTLVVSGNAPAPNGD
jgi:hypothetical protein